MTLFGTLPASYDRDMTTPPDWYFDEPDDDEDDEDEEEQEQTALIAITQLPQIRENLKALRERWELHAEDAGNMVCTADTIQSIKRYRAEMRKEFDEADTQRKAVKDRYMAAWNEVEQTWKECIAEPFKRADEAYKTQINDFEQSLKDSCKEGLKQYFGELCAVRGVDFLTLDQAMGIGGIRISMADATAKTPKRLQDSLNAIVTMVAQGMDQITQMDDAVEIMAEYKRTFDVGAAVAAVQGRKRRIEAERDAAERRKAEQERRAEAVEKVEAVLPPVRVEPPKPEKVFPEFSFTVYNCTRTQLIMIRDYLKKEGIQYE